MSYNYTNGDGLSALSASTPDGTSEPVSNLDDAIRQIKAYLLDSIAGVQAIQTFVDSISSPTTAIVTTGAVQSFASGAALAKVHFDTESIDSKNAFNPATYVFTAPTDGLYKLIASVKANKTADTVPTLIVHRLAVFVNGINGAQNETCAGADVTDRIVQIERLFQLSAGNTLDVRYQLAVATNTMTVNLTANATETILQICRLSS